MPGNGFTVDIMRLHCPPINTQGCEAFNGDPPRLRLSAQRQALGWAAGPNGLSAGRLGQPADLLNTDFIAQPFCLPRGGDTLYLSCVTLPYPDATSWQAKSNTRQCAKYMFFIFSPFWGSICWLLEATVKAKDYRWHSVRRPHNGLRTTTIY